MMGIKIVSTGKGVQGKQVSNEDLATIVETSDEWISTRTGMKTRYHLDKGTGLTDLCEMAAREAIDNGRVDKNEIGVVIVCTLSADNYCPSTACLLQKRLGLRTSIIAIDLNAACSGFVFGLETMRGLLMSTGAKKGLLIGGEVLSRKLDMTDRGTCVLFGDGAGAAVVELSDELYANVTGVESDEEMICCKVPTGHIQMDGQGTYKFAVSSVPGLILDTCKKASLEPNDIDCFVLHQANKRIIESISHKLKQPMEKFFINIEKYGNTSAASVALALNDANEQGIFKTGDKILLCAFGAGKTYGATIISW